MSNFKETAHSLKSCLPCGSPSFLLTFRAESDLQKKKRVCTEKDTTLFFPYHPPSSKNTTKPISFALADLGPFPILSPSLRTKDHTCR